MEGMPWRWSAARRRLQKRSCTSLCCYTCMLFSGANRSHSLFRSVPFGAVPFRLVPFQIFSFGSIAFGSVRFGLIWLVSDWFGPVGFDSVW